MPQHRGDAMPLNINCFLLSLVIILASALSINAEDTKQQTLTILTENAGEGNYITKDGSLSGHNVEIVREIMKRLGQNQMIEPVPWARGYYMAQNDPDTMLFSTSRIPERENLFKWAGPLHISKFTFYARKDFQTQINNIEDAKKVTAIGCIADDVRQKLLINKGFKNLDPYFGLQANIQNVKKLLAGRIDLWIASPKELITTTAEIGVNPSEIKEMLVLSKYYAYMAFSKKTSDETVAKWQKTLDGIKADGTYAQIMSKYFTGNVSMTFDRPGPAKE